MNTLAPNTPLILPIVEEELVAHSPATLAELLRALAWRRIHVTEIEMAAALGTLIERGKARLESFHGGFASRGARADARYAAT